MQMKERSFKFSRRAVSSEYEAVNNFRLEVSPEIYREGNLLDLPNKENQKFFHTKTGKYYFAAIPENFEDKILGFQMNQGFPMPSVAKRFFGDIVIHKPTYTTKDLGKGDIYSFDSLIFGGAKLLDARVDDLNNDGLLDVIYNVRDQNLGDISYRFYSEPLKGLVSEDLQSKWALIQSEMAKYVEENNGISKDMIFKFKGLVEFLKEIELKHPKIYLHTMVQFSKIANNHGGMEIYLDLVALLKNFPLVMDTASHQCGTTHTPLEYYKIVSQIVDRIQSPKRIVRALRLYNELSMIDNWNMEVGKRSVDIIHKIADLMTDEQITVLIYAIKQIDTEDFREKDAYDLLSDIKEVTDKYSYKRLFHELYDLFEGPYDVSPEILVKYSNVLSADTGLPRYKDIKYAERIIGPENATLLFNKFNITRFGRYHNTVLRHLVQMALDKNYAREKPFVLVIVARYDHSDMFDWGRLIKHDPRVRVVAVEIDDAWGFATKGEKIMKEYGVPDTIMLTMHGDKNYLAVGDPYRTITPDSIDLLSKILNKDAFADDPPKIVINACRAGNKLAQMFANYFNTEVIATDSIEALVKLDVEIKDGKASLYPHFLELGPKNFGLNIGGDRFFPTFSSSRPDFSA